MKQGTVYMQYVLKGQLDIDVCVVKYTEIWGLDM